MRERFSNVILVMAGLRPLADDAPPWTRSFALPLWWSLLVLMALAFAGENVKFVYIDF